MEPLQTSDPESIDDYRLVGRLGTGGFGVVYAALGPDGQDVAIKALRRELSDDLELRQRLAREGLALRLVSGDRTVRVHDVVTTGEHAYLVMERLEGQSLDRHINTNGPLAGPELWFAAEALTEALADIHAAGIIHRDLKPSNIIYGPQGLKVLDFGVSAVADHTALTHTGAFIGTAAWISPEQISGQPATTCSDMFTLGLVLAFAATGRHPYGEGRSDAVMYRINHAQPNLDGIPEPLREAIDRCLQRNTDDRPTTAQFAEFLRTNGQWPAEVIPMGEPVPGTSSPDTTRVVQSLQPRPTQTPLPATPPVGAATAAGSVIPTGTPITKRRRKRSLVLMGAIVALALGAVAVALTQNNSTKTVAGSAASSAVAEASPSNSGISATAENQTPASTVAATFAPTTTQIGQPRATTAAPPAKLPTGGPISSPVPATLPTGGPISSPVPATLPTGGPISSPAAPTTTASPPHPGGADVSPPAVVSSQLAPASIPAGGTVSFSLTATDASGVDGISYTVTFDATGAQSWYGSAGCGQNDYTILLTSGTTTNGTWSKSCTTPTTANPGTYTIRTFLRDIQGNQTSRTIGTFTLTSAGTADVSPPAVVSSQLAPASIPAGGTVSFSLTATDASGVDGISYTVTFDATGAQSWYGSAGCGQNDYTILLTSGTTTNGTWSKSCTTPTTANPGTYTIRTFLRDIQGNQTSRTIGTFTLT